MSENVLKNVRIVHKHDTEENWLKATNFIPKQGELIIYDVDNNYNYERMKIGDGKTLVNDLPFSNDWKSLENKPFYDTRESEEMIIEWDGNTSNKIVMSDVFYKVSDTIPTNEQIKNSIITLSDGQELEISSIWSNLVQSGFAEDDFCVLLDFVIITRKDNVVVNTPGGVAITIEKAGVYFAYLSLDEFDDVYTTSLKYVQSFGELKQLDEKYIPDTITRTSNILLQANKNSFDNLYSPVVNSDLATKEYVDLMLQAPSEMEALALVTEIGFVEPAINNGNIFVDENGAIYTI